MSTRQKRVRQGSSSSQPSKKLLLAKKDVSSSQPDKQPLIDGKSHRSSMTSAPKSKEKFEGILKANMSSTHPAGGRPPTHTSDGMFLVFF